MLLVWNCAYRWQFRNDDEDGSDQVDTKVPEIVMRVVCTDEEEPNRHSEEPFLRWRVLVTVVNLLPHVEVVIGASVEVEGDAAHPVEHDV